MGSICGTGNKFRASSPTVKLMIGKYGENNMMNSQTGKGQIKSDCLRRHKSNSNSNKLSQKTNSE